VLNYNWHIRVIKLIIPVFIFMGMTGCFQETSQKYEDDFRSVQPPQTKKLVFGLANDSITLDPANATDSESFKVTVNIFETLVEYKEDGNGIKPCLATNWEVSEDGLTWIFYLRQGVRFHDGSPFDAYAVEFNFHRWMNSDHPYHTGKFYYWYYIFSGFPGLVKEVEALSDYAVRIVLAKPYAPFLNILAMPAFGIASPRAIKKHGEKFSTSPVGTGPFSFKKWEKNHSISLTANKNYWGKFPYIDQLEFKVIPDKKDRLKELENGTVHIIDGLNPDDVVRIEKNPQLRLYLRPSFNVGFLAMNMRKKPFDNRKLRLALSHAINKDRIIEEVFNNLAKPAKNLIPPLLWGYNDDIQPYEYDPEKSKRLLREAGYPLGFKTTLWVMAQPRPYFPDPCLIAHYIQRDLQHVNIDVEIKVFEWKTYLNKIKNGEHEIALIGWTGDIRDPDNFLYTLLGPENAQPGRAGNFSFYTDEEVDRLLTRARQIFDLSFRKHLYRRLQEKIHEDVPVIPLVHSMPVLAAHRSVKGYRPLITGIESFDSVYIDTSTKIKTE